jgi:tight adherence protein C
MVEKSQQSIMEAGLSDKVTGVQLTTISYMLMVGLSALIFLLFFPQAARGSIKYWQFFFGMGVAAALGFRLPVGIVASRATKRKYEIQKALPFTFDLISISVEAGMSFDGAIATVAERTTGPLAEELRRTLREINLGIPRSEALNNLGVRSGVEDLKSFLTAVNYISRLGGSLVEVIRIQTEAMRVKRRQRAEKTAAQAPVKIMIPLVLFILPCIFLIVLGPPIMQAAKTMSGKL